MSKKDKLIVNKKHMFSNKDNKDKCNNKSNKDKCNYNKSKCKFKTKFNKEIKGISEECSNNWILNGKFTCINNSNICNNNNKINSTVKDSKFRIDMLF